MKNVFEARKNAKVRYCKLETNTVSELSKFGH